MTADRTRTRSKLRLAGIGDDVCRRHQEKTIKWYFEHEDWMANVTSGDYQKYYEEETPQIRKDRYEGDYFSRRFPVPDCTR